MIKPLAKSILLPFGLKSAALAADKVIFKKALAFRMATRTTSNKETKDIIKKFKALEDSDLAMIGSSETIKNEVKEKKVDIILMCL